MSMDLNLKEVDDDQGTSTIDSPEHMKKKSYPQLRWTKNKTTHH